MKMNRIEYNNIELYWINYDKINNKVILHYHHQFNKKFNISIYQQPCKHTTHTVILIRKMKYKLHSIGIQKQKQKQKW